MAGFLNGSSASALLAPERLRPREGTDTAQRFTRSATTAGRFLSTSDCLAWLAERRDAHGFEVDRIPFERLAGWSFSPGTGNLVHRSGRFFTVEGLRVRMEPAPVPSWTQPIIVQLEIGILGILVKEFDGVLHCLMQAKMEPGNSNVVQLSPTVQATRSNYTRIHQGRATPYLEYFLAPRRGRVLADSLQSEQGGWFLHKRNRNIVVETDDDIEVLDDYCWLTLAQVQELLGVDNVVNMDARTVLSSMPFAAVERSGAGSGAGAGAGDGFGAALRRSLEPAADALHTGTEVISWLTENKTRYEFAQERIPLDDVVGWRRTDREIAHDSGEFFRVVAVDVRAASREVTSWSQPLIAPVAPGLLALLTRRVNGVLHLLVQARPAAGAMDIVEVAPTVHCMPHTHRHTDPAGRPRYLDHVRTADPLRIRYQGWLSEEGGRFWHAKNQYVVLEVEDEFPIEVPENYRWLTVHQMMVLLRAGNCLNVEARSLLACLQTWIGR
jgi:dTDP-4-dehydro-6-deoxy-alpha-D-glucopyranose 2,3-dehydratase